MVLDIFAAGWMLGPQAFFCVSTPWNKLLSEQAESVYLREARNPSFWWIATNIQADGRQLVILKGTGSDQNKAL